MITEVTDRRKLFAEDAELVSHGQMLGGADFPAWSMTNHPTCYQQLVISNSAGALVVALFSRQMTLPI